MAHNNDLNGTVALVTGASSGIGEATASALAELGAAVAVVARRVERLEQLAERIGERNGQTLVIEADVSDAEQARRAVERTVSELGRLDTLINNAGVMLLGPVDGAPLEEWQTMIDVNVSGLLYCAHAALPHLLAAAETSPRGVADLINISSVAGRVARLGSGVYNLTKHGVGAFSESLRQEVPSGTCAYRWLSRARYRPSSPRTTGLRSRSSWPSGLVTSSACTRRTSPMRSATSSPGLATWPSTNS